jgi:hypothetical protein
MILNRLPGMSQGEMRKEDSVPAPRIYSNLPREPHLKAFFW